MGGTEGRTDRKIEVWKFPPCSTGHRPFEAAAQKPPTHLIFLCTGSSESAGIKALILPKGEEPFVKTLGVTMPPGAHALVGIDIKEVRAVEEHSAQVENSTTESLRTYDQVLFLSRRRGHCGPTFLSTSEGTYLPKMEKPKTPNLMFRQHV